MLDQEIAEGDALEADLGVADRVEDGRRLLVRRHRLRGLAQQRRDGVGDLPGQRHLDEDQRLVDQRRVEEGVAAPVDRLDPPPQVVPAADGVDRLVADDALEDGGRRRPVDPPDDQKAAVEPRAEQVGEVVVDLEQTGQ